MVSKRVSRAHAHALSLFVVYLPCVCATFLRLCVSYVCVLCVCHVLQEWYRGARCTGGGWHEHYCGPLPFPLLHLDGRASSRGRTRYHTLMASRISGLICIDTGNQPTHFGFLSRRLEHRKLVSVRIASTRNGARTD